MRRLFVLAVVLLAACGDDPVVNVPETMGVVATFPTHGSVDIATDTQAYVYFSHPVRDAGAVQTALTLQCVGAPPCSTPSASACTAQPAVSVTVSADRYSARVNPGQPLAATMCYALVISAGIASADDNVSALPSELRTAFQTR